MPADIFMPLMGLTMSEGTVARWLKAAGDPVRKGEAVLEIETDKAVIEIEATDDGVLGPILVGNGATVPVGTILSHVLAPSEQPPHAAHPEKPLDPATPRQGDPASPQETKGALQVEQPTKSTRLFASPLARRMAQEHQVDLATVEASGPGGRIVAADVRWHLDQQKAKTAETPVVRLPSPVSSLQPPPAANLTPMSGVRRLIAERMVASQQATAQVTLVLQAEATELVSWRASLKARGHAVSYNDLLVCIVAKALAEHPMMMTQITGDGQLSTPSQINIGLAVDTPRGLLVPVLRDVAGKGPVKIAAEAQALIERARSGKLPPSELTGGVFSISNLGMYEIEAFTPVINLPECAILGVGQIAEQAVVRDGQLCARAMVTLSLSFDHRIVDGAPAARFLQRMKHLVEQPLALLD
jgi:pyruvate dehydrogenase E2 component (dihydrolipoamide acetyltransferase)